MRIDPGSEDRASRYANANGMDIKEYLGGGTDGDVWKTSKNTAVKVFKYERGFWNERDCYARLAEYGVTESLDGFWIPSMLGHDDDLMVVEMDLMQKPPYIIDFAKVMIDREPDFSDEVREEAERQGEELFGHNWPAVKSLMSALESFLIFYLDPKPGNITFPNMPQ
ncbi:MAG TPA: hypothetical protein VMF30_08560 [Pirellulales bacterium]|nr:hypothetical protein [Pirellulales bacterium]